MSAPDQTSGPVPAPRTLPPGGGGKLRRAYVLMFAVSAALMAGSAAVLIASLASVGRGHRFALPAVPASAGAAIALLALAAAALAAALALKGDLLDVSALGRAGRLAFFGQAAAVTAGLVAIVFGVVLAATGEPSTILIALGVGGPASALSVIALPLRRLVRQATSAA